MFSYLQRFRRIWAARNLPNKLWSFYPRIATERKEPIWISKRSSLSSPWVNPSQIWTFWQGWILHSLSWGLRARKITIALIVQRIGSVREADFLWVRYFRYRMKMRIIKVHYRPLPQEKYWTLKEVNHQGFSQIGEVILWLIKMHF